MDVWTTNDLVGILEHITIQENYKNGVLSFRQLLADEGYAIYNTTEELYTDPETGETFPPIYSYQVTLPPSVDYTIYKAIPIEPGMDVVGLSKQPETTE